MKRTITRTNRKAILFLLSLCTVSGLFSQDYRLNFTRSGEYETVESVLVENLTQGSSLTLSGNKVLHLVGEPTSVPSTPGLRIEKMTIYPNPSVDKATLRFSVPNGGTAVFSVIDLMGRSLLQQTVQLEAGEHTFVLPAMGNGMYLVSVNGPGYRASEKWICRGAVQFTDKMQLQQSLTLEHAAVAPLSAKAQTANAAEEVQMQYNDNDLLRLTAKSGNCTTIIMKRPRIDHEVDFRFIPCTDAEGKHYAIVKIGDLFWMTENLQAARKGMVVAANQAQWAGMNNETSGMAYFGYNADNKADGAYYNYTGALAALPEGWRLPSAGEVQGMVKYLKTSGNPGELLKAKGSGTWWNTASQGLDEISFGAEAMGHIDPAGAFVKQGNYAAYWTKNKSKGKGYVFDIDGKNTDLIDAEMQVELTGGYAVRGVADAPSAYAKILTQYFENSPANAPQRAAAEAQEPLLGNTFVLTEEYKTAVSYPKADLSAMPLLRYSAAQLNAGGNENPVVVTYENGYLDFHIYNTDDVSKLDDKKRIELLTDPSHANKNRKLTFAGCKVTTSFDITFARGNAYKQWEAFWDIQVVSADLNDDGIGDFIVAVYNKLVVVDGATFEIIAEKTYAVSLVLRIALGDLTGDGRSNLAVLNGSLLQIYNNPLLIAENPDMSESYVNLVGESSFQTSDMAIGDINGSGINNLVFYSWVSDTGDKQRLISMLEYNTAAEKYEVVLKQFLKDGHHPQALLLPLAAPRFRGRAYPCDLIADVAFRYNKSTGKLENTRYLSTVSDNYLSYSVFDLDGTFTPRYAVGNFDENEEGKEQVKYYSFKFELADHSMFNPPSYGLTKMIVIECTVQSNAEGTYIVISSYKPTAISSPEGKNYSYFKDYLYGAANTTGKSRILKFKNSSFTFSEPRIHALLAAPPYYAGYDYEADMGTSWGKSSMTGSSEENASTLSGSVIFGYEQEFNVPIIGKKVGGIDFTTKIKMGSTNSKALEETITYSNTFTSGSKDCVVLTATSYQTQTYTIVKSYDPDEEDTDLLIGMPGMPQTMMITLEDFEILTGNDPKVPNLRLLFRHTPGVPLSYPRSTDEIVSNAEDPFVYFAGVFEGKDFINIGSGGSLAREIALTSEQSKSSSSNFEVESELVLSMFGVKVGGGFGYDKTNVSGSSIGEGHNVAGIVPGLNKYGDLPEYSWTLAWFNYSLGNQTFPVVHYVVK